jgi:uncharacterized protein (TIGR02118 family)
MKPGMTKVSVLYPSGDGKTFNLDYYTQKHVPMVMGLLGSAVKGASIEKGLGSAEPGSVAPFTIMASMYFDTITDFQNSFGPNAEKIMSDLPNFTNIVPSVQISEVLIQA